MGQRKKSIFRKVQKLILGSVENFFYWYVLPYVIHKTWKIVFEF